MEKLFNPGNIAVIGASPHKEKLGYQVLGNIINNGYKGKIFPINPTANEILGLETFRTVKDINETIDLAIIVVPANIVPEVLQECVAANISYAVVISAGFSEIGEKGKILQEEIKDVIIKTSPLRLVGPNCLGIISSECNLNATFAAPSLTRGSVSAVFQSGALGVALLDMAESYEFGFSKFISLGNKADLEESEIIEYLGEDKETKIIALYLENIANPKRFFEVARKVSEKKPIIILKGGTTKQGAVAAFSHTAAMVTSEKIDQAIFSQGNLIVAKSIKEMLNLLQIFATEPAVNKKDLAILTNAGGPGILSTDVASKIGLRMPPLSEKTISILKKSLPPVGSISNPLDLAGEALAKDYEIGLRALIGEDSISSILVLLTPQTMTEVEETAKVLAKYKTSNKVIVASFLGDKMVKKGIEILRKEKVPFFEEPEDAVRAIAKVTKYQEKNSHPKSFIEMTASQNCPIPEIDALELLENYNIPIPPSGIATNIDVVMKIAGRIGFPLAVKCISKKFVHKFKAGKVVLDVQSESYLKQSVEKVGYPVLIQRMVNSPFEVIIGAKREEKLGTVVTFGWGGVFTEDIDDISTKIMPLTEYDLEEMIKETKIGRILIKENFDLSSIKNIIIEVCQIMTDFPNIIELDLNPVKMTSGGAICVDARYRSAS
ncbi:TPA: hypothetical protein DD449_00505 [Candidatus Berkelbacteria bacterium]|uniref:ATP-grasp domain-containing protein n=1 Tax=Berkelbacteria bacterium GW2011_GWE1_39_12 TaxID=1618337 RepID=A0A0G4B713_9BACT|nr:MAG: hypothetical protein UT28_C0001G0986 [Berkelbacteria bacterium GW2011_GWE1_39_12]HBO60152.1 hypothetical protein [Candidatus Berkelbacteria bacterium]